MVHILLFSSVASCILPRHRVIPHLAIILVCILSPWTDFSSLWCQPLFLCSWYSYICLWFLTSFLFLCLAGIKSLMFQNYIQLKFCKIEYLVKSSLKLQRQFSSLSFLAFADLQFHFKQVSRGLSLIDNFFPDLICRKTCLLPWKTCSNVGISLHYWCRELLSHDLYLSD